MKYTSFDNQRWEVRVRGVARPLIDWSFSRERAIEHARERARETDAVRILAEGGEWSNEEVLDVDVGPENRARHH